MPLPVLIVAALLPTYPAAADSKTDSQTPPEFLQRFLEGRFEHHPTHYEVLDFAWGDLDGDEIDELIALYRLDFEVPPSKETQGKRARIYQTMLAVFDAREGDMVFEDDTRLTWCQEKTCREISVTDAGHIAIEREIESQDGGVDGSVLTLKYADEGFSVAQPPKPLDH